MKTNKTSYYVDRRLIWASSRDCILQANLFIRNTSE